VVVAWSYNWFVHRIHLIFSRSPNAVRTKIASVKRLIQRSIDKRGHTLRWDGGSSYVFISDGPFYYTGTLGKLQLVVRLSLAANRGPMSSKHLEYYLDDSQALF